MIIATLFPGADGQLDYKLMLVSLLLLLLGGSVLVWRLPVMLRTRQTRWTVYSKSAGRYVRQLYERDKRPAAYWIVCALYFLGSLVALAGFVAIMFGWERSSH
jgi:hypothetical protein